MQLQSSNLGKLNPFHFSLANSTATLFTSPQETLVGSTAALITELGLSLYGLSPVKGTKVLLL